jgi:hypothetical protein
MRIRFDHKSYRYDLKLWFKDNDHGKCLRTYFMDLVYG